MRGTAGRRKGTGLGTTHSERLGDTRWIVRSRVKVAILSAHGDRSTGDDSTGNRRNGIGPGSVAASGGSRGCLGRIFTAKALQRIFEAAAGGATIVTLG